MLYLLSQILDRSAEQFPDHDAFRCDGQGITYGDLLRRANGLAHWLIEHGVQRGDRVGIYLSKSLETAIAVYGIWKAGAAYVPLDPSAPIARTAYAINHCGIRHLITQRSKRSRLPDLLLDRKFNRCLRLSSLQAQPGNARGYEHAVVQIVCKPARRCRYFLQQYIRNELKSSGEEPFQSGIGSLVPHEEIPLVLFWKNKKKKQID